MRKLHFLPLFLVLLAGCSVNFPGRLGLPPGHGGVPPGHGGIPPGQAKKMGPPAVVVVGTPEFVRIRGSDVSVVVGVEADLFRAKDIYYYHYKNTWYRGHDYRGPWTLMNARRLPAGLRGKSPKELKSKVKKNYKKYKKHSKF